MGSYRGNVDKVMADAAKIAERLRRTPVTLTQLMAEYHCVYPTMMRAIRLYIKPAEWKQIRRRRLLGGGEATRFKKGLVPHNKGMKITPHPNSIATQFRKGHLPTCHKHVGAIRLVERDRYGKTQQYRMIKISGLAQGRHRWIMHARYIYKNRIGPIPKGFVVIHKDENSLNDDPANLEVISRAANLQLQHERDPGWLKKRIKTHKKTCRAKRRKKAAAERQLQKTNRILRRQAESQKAFELRQQFVAPVTSHWECMGCGFDVYDDQPPQKCPKCSWGSFEIIKIKHRMVI